MREEKRGPGQPRIGRLRRVTLSDEDWRALAERGARDGVSRAEVIRRAIRIYLDAPR